MKKLLSPYKKGSLELKNHMVMAPMTRSRATGNLPNDLMAEYYAQRTGAGLIITEGTAPTPEALGYPRIPGAFSDQQVTGWKQITDKVHQAASKIFLQLMHTGRIGHIDNLPKGFDVMGVSDLKAAGQIFTDSKGLQDYSQPVVLSEAEIASVIDGFVLAAGNAVKAGFDGVEIHGANGYLVEQFLNPNVNTREDQYGGSIENRSRFAVEVVKAVAGKIGPEKTGIRLSPFSTLGDLATYDEKQTHLTYAGLAKELNALKIAYIHIAVNAPIAANTLTAIREAFSGTIILSNGLTPQSAEAALQEGFADLTAFGRSFLANPDFVERIKSDLPLNQVDFEHLYTPGPVGYIDYPLLEK